MGRIEEYLAASGLTSHGLGKLGAGNPKIVARLRAGRGVSLTSIERLEAFMRSNSPAKVKAA